MITKALISRLAGGALLLMPAQAGDPAEEYKDVLPPPVTEKVPDAENGWPFFRDVPPLVYADEDRKVRDVYYVPPSEKEAGRINREFVELTVKKSAAGLDQLKRAMQLPRFQVTEPARIFAPEPFAEKALHLGRHFHLLAAQAVLQAQKGEWDHAWRDLTDIGNFAVLLQKSRPRFMEVAVAEGLFSKCAGAVCFAAGSVKSVQTLKAWAAGLERFESNSIDVRSAVQHEFAYMLLNQSGFAKGGEEAKRAVAHFIVVWGNENPAEGAKQPIEERIKYLMEHPTKEYESQLTKISGEDWAGQFQGSARFVRSYGSPDRTTLTSFRKSLPQPADDFSPGEKKGFEESRAGANFVFIKVSRSIASIRLARLALLVRAWELDHCGKLPERLEQLVPDYLSALPADPFDGKPPGYSQERRVLWYGEEKEGGGEGKERRVQALVRPE